MAFPSRGHLGPRFPPWTRAFSLPLGRRAGSDGLVITPSAFARADESERYPLALAIRPPFHVECFEIPDQEQPLPCSNNARHSVCNP